MNQQIERFRQSIRRRRIYLMRHGAVSYFRNQEGFRPDEVALNVEGRRQAAVAAEELQAAPIDRVIASTLKRTIETAQIVNQRRDIEIETVESLCEVRAGALTELHPDSIEETIAGAFRKLSRETRFLGGETFGSLMDRVGGWFDHFVQDKSWQTALIVAHGGVNRALLARALAADVQCFGSIEQEPACINVLDVDDSGRMIVRMMNFSPYNALKHGLTLTTMERLYVEFLGGSE